MIKIYFIIVILSGLPKEDLRIKEHKTGVKFALNISN